MHKVYNLLTLILTLILTTETSTSVATVNVKYALSIAALSLLLAWTQFLPARNLIAFRKAVLKILGNSHGSTLGGGVRY